MYLICALSNRRDAGFTFWWRWRVINHVLNTTRKKNEGNKVANGQRAINEGTTTRSYSNSS